MGKGGAGSPGTSVSQQRLPEETRPFYKELMSRAGKASRRPFRQYGGKRLAQYGPDELRAQRGIRDLYSAGPRQELGIATQELGKAGAYAGNVPMWGSEAYERYASPFFENVLDVEKKRIASDWDRDLSRLRLNTVSPGAYGGSGQIEQLALAQQGKQDAMREAEVTGRQRAWDQAQGAFEADRGALERAAGVQRQVAAQLQSLAQTQQSQALTRLRALEGMGAGRRELEQAALDLAYNDFLEQEAHERKMVSWLGGILHGVPLTVDQFGQTTAPGPSQGAQIAGGIIGGIGAIGSAASGLYDAGFFGGSDAAASAAGAAAKS